jgi:predicted aminopeptidase
VPDDAAFNEAFATFVEREGLRHWLTRNGNSVAYDLWLADRDRHAWFLALLRAYRAKLEAVYASGDTAATMRAAKARLFTELRAAYRELRAQWGDDGQYDHWFAQDLNNAHLAGFDLYHQQVPAFEALFRNSGRDFRQFYRAARRLARLPFEERQAQLSVLAGKAAALR